MAQANLVLIVEPGLIVLGVRGIPDPLTESLAHRTQRRTVRGEKPPLEVRYTLTPFGTQFVRVLEEIQRLQAQLDEHERKHGVE